MIRTYTELMKLKTFEERYEYLRLAAIVGESTFGFDRYLNQAVYTSREWRRLRDKIIIRDNGCDLALEDYEIRGKIIIHHMNPITVQDALDRNDEIFDPEFLICTSMNTHNAIHYGDKQLLPQSPIVRTPGDTCPWKRA